MTEIPSIQQIRDNVDQRRTEMFYEFQDSVINAINKKSREGYSCVNITIPEQICYIARITEFVENLRNHGYETELSNYGEVLTVKWYKKE